LRCSKLKEILILKVNEIIDEICPLLDSLFDDWVVKGIAREENQIRFSQNQIDINKSWQELKLELFLAIKRRTLEISLVDLRKERIEKNLNECVKKLKASKLNLNYKKLPFGPFSYNSAIQENIYDNKVENLGEKAIDLTHLAIEEALSQGTERVAGTFFFGSTKFLLTSSTGLSGEYIRTNLNFRIRAFARDLHATGEAISCSTHMNKRFNPIEAGKEAGEIARASIGSKRGVPGTYNIIIYPKVATELQAPTPAIAMNSYVHKMGLAWLVGKKVGDQIANECISVWDDGTIPQGLRTAPFDDELVPTNRTLLIDKGKIKAFYTNTSLAKKGEKSTGNAGITMPKPTNTVFSKGDYSLEELMEISEKSTLLITSTWYTRYQSYAPPGILSSLPKDGMFLIKNKGKTLEPVKELRINSDHYHLLNNTVALGKELKQVITWISPGNNSIFAPFMLIEDIKMTTGTK